MAQLISVKKAFIFMRKGIDREQKGNMGMVHRLPSL
jgi:hypothetical protein